MPPPRILITRAPNQASELAEHLRALHLEPILIPTIEIASPSTFAPLDHALAHLDRFHWLLFTSANAVEAFHRRLAPASSDPPGGPGLDSQSWVALPPHLRIAAIGAATARALEAIHLQPDLIPAAAVAESLAAALLLHVCQGDGGPTRFLLVRAEAARDRLPDTLRATGAEVTVAPAYRTLIPEESVARIQRLFSTPAQWPDAITFTSSSTATNLQALLEGSGLTLPPAILRISIGPITSQTLRELGLPPHAEAEQPTVLALAAAVVKALDSHTRR